jgi:hypothetical protein
LEPIANTSICGDFKDDDENDYSFTLENDGNLLLTSRSKNMKGTLASNDEVFEGDIICDGRKMSVRLNGTRLHLSGATTRLALEWWPGHATTWLRRHFEGLINPHEQERTYSSVYNDNEKGTGHAQSMLNSPQAWSAKHNSEGEWMQLDLGEEKCVRGVVVQGRCSRAMQAVTQFGVSYCIDGVNFKQVEQAFRYATQNFDESKDFVFQCGSVKARYIKFTVQKWQSHASMRAAVLEGGSAEGESDGQLESRMSSSGAPVMMIADGAMGVPGMPGQTVVSGMPRQPLVMGGDIGIAAPLMIQGGGTGVGAPTVIQSGGATIQQGPGGVQQVIQVPRSNTMPASTLGGNTQAAGPRIVRAEPSEAGPRVVRGVPEQSIGSRVGVQPSVGSMGRATAAPTAMRPQPMSSNLMGASSYGTSVPRVSAQPAPSIQATRMQPASGTTARVIGGGIGSSVPSISTASSFAPVPGARVLR